MKPENNSFLRKQSTKEVTIKWNPDFSSLQGKRKLVRKFGEFEKSGVKLECLTEERQTTFRRDSTLNRRGTRIAKIAVAWITNK